MRRYRTMAWGGPVTTLTLLAAACGSDDGQSNPTPVTVLSKPSKSGDNQTAAPQAELAQPLRVLVTRDDQPAEQVSVTWTTPGGGSMGAATSLTDANGIAQVTWTLGAAIGPQEARASVTGATNSPLRRRYGGGPGRRWASPRAGHGQRRRDQHVHLGSGPRPAGPGRLLGVG